MNQAPTKKTIPNSLSEKSSLSPFSVSLFFVGGKAACPLFLTSERDHMSLYLLI